MADVRALGVLPKNRKVDILKAGVFEGTKLFMKESHGPDVGVEIQPEKAPPMTSTPMPPPAITAIPGMAPLEPELYTELNLPRVGCRGETQRLGGPHVAPSLDAVVCHRRRTNDVIYA